MAAVQILYDCMIQFFYFLLLQLLKCNIDRQLINIYRHTQKLNFGYEINE